MNKPQTLAQLDNATRQRIEAWMQDSYDPETRSAVIKLVESDPKAASDAFYTTLSFGTGGLRGVMGVGSNRMNRYTVHFATQGLANYLKTQEGSHAVFIGYDCRHDSEYFALEAARVLAGNGIRAYVTETLRPTPLVSFGCRLKGCSAAIMITASHNPPEYNGYKVYWNDGAQILPPHDKGIMEAVATVAGPEQVQLAEADSNLIERVGEDVDQAYLESVASLQHYPELNAAHGKQLKVVFSNLHGTAITLVPQALASWGFTDFISVEAQEPPSGDFPTVKSPNPEEPEALSLGIERLKNEQGDLLLACDPDADRMGAVVMHNGEPVALNGNQIACLCLAHLLEALRQQHRLPERAAFVKTIVTTELFRVIAEDYNKPSFDVLTGFKYIAEKIRLWEQEEDGYKYIFGGEESYGYLLGTHSRDKDAVVSCCLLAEAALHAKLAGRSLIDQLQQLYRRHGIYREGLLSIKFSETQEGRTQMSEAMATLRKSPPQSIAGALVKCVEDYQSGLRVYSETGKSEQISLPKSNILAFWLEDETKMVVRPSGTEPKVKLYCGTVSHQFEDMESAIERADKRTAAVLEEVRQLMQGA